MAFFWYGNFNTLCTSFKSIILSLLQFSEGSTIELSCDGPIREPFIAYMQGGLTYNYGKFGILKAIQEME